jgi:hypothetical protein
MAARVSAEELEEFNAKADMVASQVQALLAGTLEPEDVKLPGQDSWAFASATARAGARAADAAAADDAERARSAALQRKWDAERAERLAGEERERWWKFARMQFGDAGAGAGDGAGAGAGDGAGGDGGGGAAARLRPAVGAGRAIDYSWWDKWAMDPDDPVTRAEDARVAAEKEAAQNRAFEEANAGFCMSFKADQLQREAAERSKAARAEALKARGNAAFAGGDFPAAIGAYHDALRLAPFSAAVLNNVAAAHLALKDWAAAREFATRTVFIEPAGSAAAVKARFRRAHAARELGDAAAALEDLEAAARAEPASADVARALRAARIDAAERAKEAALPLPRAPASVAADGLPSAGAIADAVALADMDARAVIERAAARLARLAALRAPAGGAAPAGATELTNELRAASRELRAAAARLDADEARVLARTTGLLAAAAGELRDTAAAVAGARAAAAGGALAHMAVAAAAAHFLAAAADNAKNRVLVRGERVAGSALGAALDLLALPDALAAGAWAAAFDPVPTPAAAAAAAATAAAAEWLPQLRGACASLAEAFARPSAEDPEGRAALVAHAFFRADAAAPACGTIAQRLAADAAALSRFAPGRLPAGSLDALATTARVLQALCVAAPTRAAERGAKRAPADPAALIHEVVMRAVDALAGDGGGGGGGGGAPPAPARTHPAAALLACVTALLGRALLDGEALLWSPAMVAAVGALANLAQREAMRGALLADAAGAAGAAALRPLVDLLRIPVPAPAPADWDAVRGSALAALSNVCLDGAGAVEVVARAGAVAVTLGMLTGATPLPAALRGRTATLLGRLATSAAAAAALAGDAAAVRHVVALLAKSAAAPPAVLPDWARATLVDSEGAFQDGLLRLLAGAGDGVAEAVFAAGGVAALAAALRSALAPAAPAAAGAPPARARTVGAGNACKVLIALAAHAPAHDAFLRDGACDALADALKSPGPDGDAAAAAVRRNAAAAIARLMRHPACAERLRAQRAMEVLLSLNREGGL